MGKKYLGPMSRACPEDKKMYTKNYVRKQKKKCIKKLCKKQKKMYTKNYI